MATPGSYIDKAADFFLESVLSQLTLMKPMQLPSNRWRPMPPVDFVVTMHKGLVGRASGRSQFDAAFGQDEHTLNSEFFESFNSESAIRVPRVYLG